MKKMCSGVEGRPCGRIIPVTQRYCAECQRARNAQKNRYSRDRGYRSAGWQKIAKRFLEDHPTCGCGQPSQIAHHRNGLRPNDAGGADVGMLEALCASCHQLRHGELRRAQKKGPIF